MDELSVEMAAPTLEGPRRAWITEAFDALTPSRLAGIMRAADAGEVRDFLTLAQQMEERDLHYASVLGTRKRAVGALDQRISPASGSEQDMKIANAVQKQILENPCFQSALDDLLDALGKGYSAVEILWERGALLKPVDFAWRDPRWFVLDERTGRELLLLEEQEDPQQDPQKQPLPAYKFMIHMPGLKSGLPVRNGLARLAALAYMCKSFTIRDWMAWLELYGTPLRLGRYGSEATQQDITVLKRALRDLGADAWAAMPENMNIEFLSHASGRPVFEAAADWWDRQVSKAILGQTASAEGTPGKLGNEQAQADVRQDILRSDARNLAATVQRDLVRPFVDLNFGLQESYPRFSMLVQDTEDVQMQMQAVARLAPLGLKVGQGAIRRKLGLPDPAEDEELLNQG